MLIAGSATTMPSACSLLSPNRASALLPPAQVVTPSPNQKKKRQKLKPDSLRVIETQLRDQPSQKDPSQVTKDVLALWKNSNDPNPTVTLCDVRSALGLPMHEGNGKVREPKQEELKLTLARLISNLTAERVPASIDLECPLHSVEAIADLLQLPRERIALWQKKGLPIISVRDAQNGIVQVVPEDVLNCFLANNRPILLSEYDPPQVYSFDTRKAESRSLLPRLFTSAFAEYEVTGDRQKLIETVSKYSEAPFSLLHYPLFILPCATQVILDTPEIKDSVQERAGAGSKCSDDSKEYGNPLGVKREQDLFLKYNYLKWRAWEKAKRLISSADVDESTILSIHDDLVAAQGIKSVLVKRNLGLTIIMGNKVRAVIPLVGGTQEGLVNEGSIAILRALDKFDVRRGFKFSTYCCQAIKLHFYRVCETNRGRTGKVMNAEDGYLEQAGYVQDRGVEKEVEFGVSMAQVLSLIGTLNEYEQLVLSLRFPQEPGVKPHTLEQIAPKIGVTKERVRQIQNGALVKLREAIEESNAAGGKESIAEQN